MNCAQRRRHQDKWQAALALPTDQDCQKKMNSPTNSDNRASAKSVLRSRPIQRVEGDLAFRARALAFQEFFRGLPSRAIDACSTILTRVCGMFAPPRYQNQSVQAIFDLVAGQDFQPEPLMRASQHAIGIPSVLRGITQLKDRKCFVGFDH